MVTAVMGFFPSRGSLQRKFLPSHMKERERQTRNHVKFVGLTDTAKNTQYVQKIYYSL